MVGANLGITGHPLQQSRAGIELKPARTLAKQAISENVTNGQVLILEDVGQIECERLILHRGDRPKRHGYRSVIDIGNRERHHLLPRTASSIESLDLIAMDTNLGLVSQPIQHGQGRRTGAHGNNLPSSQRLIGAGGQLRGLQREI